MSAPTDRTPPRARPVAALAAPVLALALVAVAVVAVRDLLVDRGRVGGTPWSRDLVDAADGLTASTALTVAGLAAAVVGLLLVVAALLPGRRTHLRGSAAADLWVSPGALAALAQTVADRSPGVVSAATTRVGRRRVTVEVVAREGEPGVRDAVRAALDDGPGALTAATVGVRLQEVPR
ncbi:DUF6286 domain-containing protein [Nocardioides dongxiaopingii]|uniref:DUF6286 domain-containing protein n=1 Tax=Nocardioides dongxiaopingii TaxID=2576036 RepID=UPI0010C76821|nr:DUF6286 domain-containing protein [Nocardioides dongxiaopingii]